MAETLVDGELRVYELNNNYIFEGKIGKRRQSGSFSVRNPRSETELIATLARKKLLAEAYGKKLVIVGKAPPGLTNAKEISNELLETIDRKLQE